MIISNTERTDGGTACGIGGPMVKKQSQFFRCIGTFVSRPANGPRSRGNACHTWNGIGTPQLDEFSQ